jgi:hypothetical protein
VGSWGILVVVVILVHHWFPMLLVVSKMLMLRLLLLEQFTLARLPVGELIAGEGMVMGNWV